jgi:hypothetical protein
VLLRSPLSPHCSRSSPTIPLKEFRKFSSPLLFFPSHAVLAKTHLSVCIVRRSDASERDPRGTSTHEACGRPCCAGGRGNPHTPRSGRSEPTGPGGNNQAHQATQDSGKCTQGIVALHRKFRLAALLSVCVQCVCSVCVFSAMCCVVLC